MADGHLAIDELPPGTPLPADVAARPHCFSYDPASDTFQRRPPRTRTPERTPPSTWQPTQTGDPGLDADIASSRRAQARSTELHSDLPPAEHRRTVAASADEGRAPTRSGEIDMPDGYENRTAREVQDHAQTTGHQHQPNAMLDHDGPGSHTAVHAEQQHAVVHPNEPVGVSRPMCRDCRTAFRHEAAAQGQRQVVTDPDMTRVFHPDGSVTEYRPDGSVGRIGPNDPY